jgi:hypothetical protein
VAARRSARSYSGSPADGGCPQRAGDETTPQDRAEGRSQARSSLGQPRPVGRG